VNSDDFGNSFLRRLTAKDLLFCQKGDRVLLLNGWDYMREAGESQATLAGFAVGSVEIYERTEFIEFFTHEYLKTSKIF